MAVVATLASAANWGVWQGPAGGQSTRAFDDFTLVPPDDRWDRSIHMRRFQGDVSQWIPGDAGSLSRAQLSAGSSNHPYGVTRWTEFWTYHISLATLNSDDFHMLWEVHTPSANPGGIITYNLRTGPLQKMGRQWVGPGSFTHAYRGRDTLAFFTWDHHIFGYRPHLSNGYYQYIRNGVELYEQDGYASTTQSGNHYPEIGFYTYWSASGTDDACVAGLRIHDTEPPYPGDGGGPPPPPPTAPAAVTGLTAVGGLNSINLSWTNPVDAAVDEVFIKRQTSGPINVYTDGTLVAVDTTDPFFTSYSDTGLLNGTLYHYGVFRRKPDGSGGFLFSPVTRVSATTDTPPTPPPPSAGPGFRSANPRADNLRGNNPRS